MQRYRNNPSSPSLLLEAWFLNQVVSRWLSDRVGDVGLSPDELGLCSLVALEGDLSTTRISEVTGGRPSTVSSMATRLARRGLLDQIPHPTDRRARQWHLTEAGTELLDEATTRFRAAYQELLSTTALQVDEVQGGIGALEHALRSDLGLPPRPVPATSEEEDELTPAEQQELRTFKAWLIHRRATANRGEQ